MARVALTTVDNPYDPFTQFKEWYAFDTVQKGYYTSEYLARIAPYSSEMPDEMVEILREKAIDEIVELNVLGIYKKVTKETA